VVTHQLQVERRTAKAHRPKTDALPLDHVTNLSASTAGNLEHVGDMQCGMAESLKSVSNQ